MAPRIVLMAARKTGMVPNPWPAWGAISMVGDFWFIGGNSWFGSILARSLARIGPENNTILMPWSSYSRGLGRQAPRGWRR